MRRYFKSLMSLSLLQQLSMIIITLAVVLVLFFTVYLRGNITDFVSAQVMNLLERSQNSIVANLKEGNYSFNSFSYSADITHMVYRNNQLQEYNQKIDSPIFAQTVNELISQHEYDDNTIEGVFTAVTTYYYRIVSIDKKTEVISIIPGSYALTIESSLLSSVSNNTAWVFFIVFLFMIAWVTTIITPLQQIRNYIDKVRDPNVKDVSLNIERADEIGELAKALVSMREELKAQEETKEELIHNISHDLKTPISTIKSYAESIKDGIYPYDTLDKSVDVIIQNAERLEKKVKSLLFLNRLDYLMDQEKNTTKETDVNKVVNDVILSLKMIKPEINIDTIMQPTTFKGDEESWRVVISNLLDNALRYAKSYILITVAPNHFSIRNDGSTLSKERMEKLFKPFEKGTKGNFGLGLSICYKVCNGYGYTIAGENTEDGVIFSIDYKEKKKRKA